MAEEHHHHYSQAPAEHAKITQYPKRSLPIRVLTNILKFLLKNRWKVLLLGIFLLIFINYTRLVKDILIILVLMVIGSFSTFYKYRVKISLGVELVTMVTVLTSLVYGPIIGAIVGVISSTLSVVLPQMVDASDVLYIVSKIVVAIVVYILRGSPLMFLCVIALVIEWIMSEPLRLMSGSIELRMMSFLYMSTGLIWNIFVFIYLAPPLLNMMGGVAP